MILLINIVIHSHKLTLLSVRVYSTSSLSWSLAVLSAMNLSLSPPPSLALSLPPSLPPSLPYGNVFPEVFAEFFWFVLKRNKKDTAFWMSSLISC